MIRRLLCFHSLPFRIPLSYRTVMPPFKLDIFCPIYLGPCWLDISHSHNLWKEEIGKIPGIYCNLFLPPLRPMRLLDRIVCVEHRWHIFHHLCKDILVPIRHRNMAKQLSTYRSWPGIVVHIVEYLKVQTRDIPLI